MAGEESAETKFCTNCKKDIAASNFLMHEIHCKRHIVLCEICHEPVPRSEKDQHFAELHAKTKCPQCSQELEKDKLENHLESQCHKRMITCEFCELQLPFSELDGHTDYCGSRTEPCPKCLQYIMMKDQAQHDASNCQFPAPKPQPAPSNGTGFDLDARGSLQDDLERLQEEEFVRALRFSRPDSLFPSLEMDFAEMPSGPSNGSRSMASRAASIQNQLIRGNLDRKATNKKSNVNKERDRRTGQSGAEVDEASDRLLALRLQREEDEMMDQMLRDLQKEGSETQNSPHSPSPHQISPNNGFHNTFPQEDEFIPCEFCGDSFPMELLFEHQSRCDPMASGMFEPPHSGFSPERNNEIPTSDLARLRRNDAIPVINNLDHNIQRFADPGSVSPPPEMFADSEEESVMLPCEFCQDQFPGEMLVMHQSVCEHNPLSTPRVQTPVVSGRSNLRKTNIVSPTAETIIENFTRPRSQRYQPPPQALGPDGFYEDLLSRGIQEMLQMSPSPEDMYAPQSAASPDSNLQAMMQRYGVETDRNIDVYSRGARSGLRNLQDNAGNLREQPRRRPNRPNRMQPTQDVLNQLMDVEAEQVPGPGNAYRKSTKNQDNVNRRSSLNNLSGPEPASRRQPVTDARSVQRMLENSSRQGPPPRQRNRTRASGGGVTPDDGAGGDSAGVARSRQRGDHLFNHNPRSQPLPPHHGAPRQRRSPFQGPPVSQDIRRTDPNAVRRAPRRDSNQ